MATTETYFQLPWASARSCAASLCPSWQPSTPTSHAKDWHLMTSTFTVQVCLIGSLVFYCN